MTITFSRPTKIFILSAVLIEVILIYNAILWESASESEARLAVFLYDNTMHGAHSA